MNSNPEAQDASARLIDRIADLEEKEALSIVAERIARGDQPLKIVDDCREGLRIVGERYERREYFLAGLIMAGEIFSEAMELLEPIIVENYRGNEAGTILLGTVKGDIHDIGKNIFRTLLTSFNFTVHDLGVNVPPQRFLEEAIEHRPDIVGLSGLVTSSYESMKETIDLLRAENAQRGLQVPIVIGGGTINADVCQRVGADFWANDAMEGIRIFQRILGEKG